MTLADSQFDFAETYWADLKKMLRAVRAACGLTQDNIAAALHIHRATYTNYESGKTYPDVPTLIALSAIFKLPPDSFLYPDEYKALKTAKKRVRHAPAVDPQKIGDLSEEEKKIIAAYRLQTNFPPKTYDKMSRTAETALGQFLIKKTYRGYPFLVSAIREAAAALPDRLTTSEICELVAANEGADPAAVHRELARMVTNIWNYAENPPIYSEMVGQKTAEKPLPVEFIYGMADYLSK